MKQILQADDVIGKMSTFQAPDEGTGTDAILVAAGIAAVSEGDFSSSNNATKLSFKTGASEAATEKMTLSSTGVLTAQVVLGNTDTDTLASDASVLKFGADGDINITHVHNTGLTSNGTLDVAGALTAAGVTSDVGGNVISNLQTPALDLDAANKGYVDNAFSNVDLANLDITLPDTKIFVGTSSNTAVSVMLNGDATLTNSGTITITDNAVGDDQLDKENISLTGFASPTATLDMNNNVISNLQTDAPTVSAFRLNTRTTGNANFDAAIVYVNFIR